MPVIVTKEHNTAPMLRSSSNLECGFRKVTNSIQDIPGRALSVPPIKITNVTNVNNNNSSRISGRRKSSVHFETETLEKLNICDVEQGKNDLMARHLKIDKSEGARKDEKSTHKPGHPKMLSVALQLMAMAKQAKSNIAKKKGAEEKEMMDKKIVTEKDKETLSSRKNSQKDSLPLPDDNEDRKSNASSHWSFKSHTVIEDPVDGKKAKYTEFNQHVSSAIFGEKTAKSSKLRIRTPVIDDIDEEVVKERQEKLLLRITRSLPVHRLQKAEAHRDDLAHVLGYTERNKKLLAHSKLEGKKNFKTDDRFTDLLETLTKPNSDKAEFTWMNFDLNEFKFQ